jgi:Ca2+-binding EF-hand superfamily protein
MLSYDADRDGIVTRSELEDDIRRQFASANMIGSPLSLDAFAANARSAFRMLDRNKDDRLTSDELRL